MLAYIHFTNMLSNSQLLQPDQPAVQLPPPPGRSTMHELDISKLVPEPQSSETASEESDKNIKDPGDSPAICVLRGLYN